MNLKGIEYLRRKLASKRTRVELRYKFYESKNLAKDLGISTPPQLRYWQSAFGWCGKAVDGLADRLVFNGFKEDTDFFNFNEIYNMNNPDVLFDSAVTSALIASCCFIYISVGEDGFPRMQIIDGGNATGVIDPITGLLYEGYAVLERDEKGCATIDAYFEPGKTTVNYLTIGESEVYETGVYYPMLVPIIYRPDAKRPFGHSRISRACMDIQNAAIRTLKRSEISAEFYSFPQKYVTGLSDDAEILDKWASVMSSMLQFGRDENGQTPSVGQFQQQSMAPHTEQLRMLASLFAGEAGLTLDDLGFSTGNPASSEAIKAAHENLRLAARKAQRDFGSGFLNAGMLAASLRDGKAYERKAFYKTKALWLPLFEPDAAMLSQIGDGAIKLNQAIPGYFDSANLEELTGIPSGVTETNAYDFGI